MTVKTLECPNCHALIETFDETTKKGFCPFCDALILDVQERQSTFAVSERGDVMTKEADFVIKGGVLMKYNGESTDIVVPDNVICIGQGAFSELKGIKSVILPKGVEEIGLAAFTYCTRLEHVTFPSTLSKIEYAAFNHCESLRKAELPNSLRAIDDRAFEYCFNLQEVVLPSELISIGRRAFLGCISLSAINLPSSLRSIGASAFSCCRSLTELTIPKELSFQKSGMIYGSDYDDQDIDSIPGESIDWISGHSIAWTPLHEGERGISETSQDFISSYNHAWKLKEGRILPSPIKTLYFESEEFADRLCNLVNCMIEEAAKRGVNSLTADKFPDLVLLE